MVHLGSIVINVSDIGRAAKFWASALGYVPRPDNPAVLAPRTGDGPLLVLDEHDRTHLDLSAADAGEMRAEVDRLVSLGARRVEDWAYPANANFVVLADPDGNLFCVVDAGAD
jgi:catechol 2,3-dioxygenase-like lactoylglutathione lyase family enzyme